MALSGYSQMAVADFRRARRQASMADIMARLTGHSNDLLSYEDVRRRLRAQQSGVRILKDIPLDAIVGSVGRYTDFARGFLPRNESDKTRWLRVRGVMEGMEGVPPIEVYQIGDAYFVADGNHRVSIARQLGSTHIQAYVTPVQSRVPFSPTASPDELIVKEEYATFLERTDLDRTRPGCDLQMTAPGHYYVLEEEIEQERKHMEAEHRHEVSFQDAAAVWYDTVYMPVVHVIRERGMLRDFPDRTETDMYAWTIEHRNAISNTLGWDIDPAAVVSEAVSEHKPQQPALRLGERLLDVLTPEVFEPGPQPGQWRQTRADQSEQYLFNEILVPISGQPEGWFALEQAIVFAQKEEGVIYGLHVVANEQQRHTKAVQELREEFAWRCKTGAIDGRLGVEVGTIAERIAQRARLVDLIVLNLAHPPGRRPSSRLRSGFRAVIQHSPCPVLAVPQMLSYCERLLLSYDGSPKSKEALFVASYLADTWKAELAVMTVAEVGRTSQTTLDQARQYLAAHHVQATYITERGPVADSILRTAKAQHSDLVLMGGYGSQPMLEFMLGSTVDQIFRASQLPTLVCQ